MEPLAARDVACGDLHPGAVTCEAGAGPASWCVGGDGLFTLADAVVLRRLPLDVSALDCAGCAARAAGPATMPPGDVAPRAAPDGNVTVADVVVLLRLAVGLEPPSPAELLQGDVAPAAREEGVTAPRGDGLLDVADVVLALRAAVGLETLAWPRRQLVARLAAPVTAAAMSLAVLGWPPWAEAPTAACAGGAEASIDAAGDRWGLTCLGTGSALRGPGDVATLSYRAPGDVAPAVLLVRSQLVDATLAPVPVNVTLAVP